MEVDISIPWLSTIASVAAHVTSIAQGLLPLCLVFDAADDDDPSNCMCHDQKVASSLICESIGTLVTMTYDNCMRYDGGAGSYLRRHALGSI